MTNIELAELVENTNMYDIAEKTIRNLDMSNNETQVAEQLDAHFRDIGKRGVDADHEVAAFIQKVINDELYNTPDELLDAIFERGTINEGDDFQGIFAPKNKLVAYEAGKGGNVDRSYIDISVMAPKWHNKQIESDISYADLSRNGWKTVALYTDYAIAALKNTMFADIFTDIAATITSGDNYIDGNASSPTQAEADQMVLYIQDRAESGDGIIVGHSNYIQKFSKMTGFNSEEMLNEIHRTGRLGMYDGVSLFPISRSKKLGNGTAMLPAGKVFGIAGKCGVLNMKGDVTVYQTMDNNKEQIHLLFKNFTYGYAFNNAAIDKIVVLDCNA